MGGGQNMQFGSALDAFGKYAKPEAALANSDNKEAEGMNIDEEDGGTNALIMRAPRKPFEVNGRQLKMQFPMPCQILKETSERLAEVMLATPFSGIQVSVKLSTLERNRETVREKERDWIANALNGKAGHAVLGYLSVDEIDNQSGGYQKYSGF